MKIALCGRFNTDIKHQGGSSEVMLVLARLLSKEHDVTLFGRGKPTQDIIQMCRHHGITFYCIPSDTFTNIVLGPLRALILMRKHFDNFDIIHAHNGSYAIASTVFRKRSKVIIHVHEIVEPKYNNFVDTIYLSIECHLLKFAAKKAHLTLTVSEYLKNILENKWKIKNVKILQNGTDESIFKYSRNEDVNKLFKEDSYKVLYVGRLVQRKGVLELIDSFKYINGQKISLMVVGYGNLQSTVANKVYQDDNITLIPYVEQRKLPFFYSAADLVIIPSKYEPSPLVAKEALACGTPVLVSNNTGLSELKNAYFIDEIRPEPIANAIIKISKIKTPNRTFYRNHIVKNYTWTKSIDALTLMYEQLTMNSGR